MSAKIRPLSGFPELLPEQRVVEQQVIDTLRHTFELHGFAGIETRAVEPLDQLLRKGDTSKEVYLLRRLQEESPEGHAGLGLHFDLTVPFARYVLENAGEAGVPVPPLPDPEGVAGRASAGGPLPGVHPGRHRHRRARHPLAFHHDIEVTRVMLDALSRLELLPGFRLQVNNRKLIQGFYAGSGIDDVDEVMRLVDKLDKLPVDRVRAMLVDEAGITDDQAEQVLALAAIRSTDASFVDRVRALGVEHPLLDEGLTELEALVAGCAGLVDDRVRIEADLSIARGLDYYTGTVFETRLDGHESLGSICSGGRYDALASDGRTTYPGVGISLGLSRVVVTLLARTGTTADRSVPSAVLVALNDEESRPEADEVAAALRSRDIACEVAASAAKFGKQIRYAERRGIPFVWFAGESGHQVKDIRTGEQVDADPATWAPPSDDLRPKVVSRTDQEQKQ